MSTKHNEKTVSILMVLLLLTTLSLGFTLHVIHMKPTREVEKVRVTIPVIVPMIDLQESIVPLSAEPILIEEEVLSGTELYVSYVDEITTNVYPDVDPLEVKAIIYNESRYDPTSVNERTGVVGLMQINPKWHTDRAARLGVDDLADPYGSILVGCDLLSELQQTHSKSYSLNVYAGGYPYADAYANSKSPYEILTEETMAGIASGEIVLGGD